MTRKYFGTDGIRGRVGEGNIHPEFVLKLGFAAGRVLGGEDGGKVVIGKDTRISGYMFEAALESGLAAAGMDVYLLGPMPTPAIAYLARTLHASAGIVISASHNPHWDNGIKFFSGRGRKLSDEVELAIEAELERPMVPVDSRHIGKAYRVDDAQGRYIEFCKSSVPWEMNLRGLKLVVDCAHGATYHVAPPVFEELGAEVIAIGNQPNGLNINDGCGSTHLAALQKAVLQHGADLGIALDGDGDRVLLVDDRGQEVDGDGILFIIARGRQRRGLLKGSVVGTQMSNLGLELALKDLGIGFERTKVGDRYIMERLRANDWNLGGEPSGHMICLDRTTTGDGIISALQVLEEMRATGQTLRELTGGMSHFPQVLRNIRLKGGHDVLGAPAMQQAVADAETALGGRGRILLRPSGTEPLLRIMVEGEEREQVEGLAKQLEQVALGCLEG